MRLSFTLVIITTLISAYHTQYIYYCYLAHECMNQSFVSTETAYFISGYKGAYGLATSFEGQKILCRGALSCKSMLFIKIIEAAGRKIDCAGSNSCSETYIDTIACRVYCNGWNACTLSTITGTDNELSCNGDQSCSHSHIQSAETIKGYGVYSLYNATIDTMNSTSDVTIELNGESAAYGATLICREGHICNIYCNGRTSCNMFYIDCIGTCNIYNASIDTIVPITDITHLNLNPINDSLNSRYIVENNEILCNTQTTALTFDNYNERNSDITMSFSDEGPICCRAEFACDNVNYIGYQSEGMNTVICSAERSCSQSQLYVHNGTVFCEAEAACWRSQISEASGVYCLGAGSCQTSIITGASMVICSGYISCKTSIFSSAGTDLDIYFTGYESGDGVTLNCSETDVCNIYCRGLDSCSSVSVYCYGICNEECDTASGCPIHITNYTHTATVAATTTSSYLTSTITSYLTTFLSPEPTIHSRLPSFTPSKMPSLQPWTHLPTLQEIYNTTTITTSIHYTTIDTTHRINVLYILAVLLSVLIGMLLCAIFVIFGLTQYLRMSKQKKSQNDIAHTHIEVVSSDNQHEKDEVNKTTIIYNMNAENDEIVIGDDEVTKGQYRHEIGMQTQEGQ